MAFQQPHFNNKSFTCPHCGVLARQNKWGLELNSQNGNRYAEEQIRYGALKISVCDNCSKNCLWIVDKYIYPDISTAPLPNVDMPSGVKEDYDEAATIYTRSPRGAAALLRLAIQKLMVHLGQTGKNINDDIGALVSNGLPVTIQQALDVVRVTGNNAVHPGLLDANDKEIVEQLFSLVNLIVEYQISLPARVQQAFDSLPEGAKAGIAKRDGTK